MLMGLLEAKRIIEGERDKLEESMNNLVECDLCLAEEVTSFCNGLLGTLNDMIDAECVEIEKSAQEVKHEDSCNSN